MNIADLKIMFVEPYGQMGGSQRYLLTLLESLPRETVATIVCLQEGPFPQMLTADGYPVDLLSTGPKPADIVRSAIKLRKILKQARPDLIHSNGLKSTLTAGLSALGSGVPIIWTKHDFSWEGWPARTATRFSHTVIGVSEAVTQNLAGHSGHTKIRTIYNGIESPSIDRKLARRALLDAIGAHEPVEVVAIVGRLHEVKGHDQLLDALPRLRERLPSIRIAIIGGDDPTTLDHAQHLRKRVEREEAGDSVSFLGYRPDAIELIAGCDALAIPSGEDRRGMGGEAFPYTALEGLAVGVPVVAYSGGGIPEAVGECGLLVPPGNSEALAHALIEGITNAEIRTRLSRCGPKRVATRFGIHDMVAATHSIYERAVE